MLVLEVVGCQLRRVATLIALVLIGASQTGCSTIKLGYNNAPTLAYWWLDGYMDIEDHQSQSIREALERLHQWHRVNELPKIEALLQRAEVMLASDVTPAQVCVALTDVRDRIAAASNQTLPSVAAIATSLSAAQRQHIARKFEKNNAVWQEEWNDPDPEARREKRLKAAVENAEQLYDSLTEKQIALLRELDASSSYDTAVSYKERLRRQKDWLQTFARLNPPNPADKPDLAQANIIVQETFARNSQSPDPNYRAFAEKMYAESCNAFAVIHNSTTPKQRERAIKRIAAYARDARELMTVKPTK